MIASHFGVVFGGDCTMFSVVSGDYNWFWLDENGFWLVFAGFG